ncbi:hypothetical protein PAMP_007332 [Pampus punctatissimus]
MIENSDLPSAVLTLASVMSVTLLFLLCLQCKRKSKIIHEETQIYNPQTFQRGGSRFAVMQSKTVTRANQITSTSEAPEELPPTAMDESDYENIEDGKFEYVIHTQTGSPEHTYVAPIAASVYENEQIQEMRQAHQRPPVYGNIEPLPNTEESSSREDEGDYENSDFLQKEEDDEPDYENT